MFVFYGWYYGGADGILKSAWQIAYPNVFSRVLYLRGKSLLGTSDIPASCVLFAYGLVYGLSDKLDFVFDFTPYYHTRSKQKSVCKRESGKLARAGCLKQKKRVTKIVAR